MNTNDGFSGQNSTCPRRSLPGLAVRCRAGDRFCSECGAALSKVCRACAASVTPGQRYCGACGTWLGAVADNSGATTGLGAERRLMTVVMCDLVGSSALAARLDPEEFAALLVAYRERCAAVVAQNGGAYISRYVGDGVLACFGYPRALGRDAHSAVSCGLAIAHAKSAGHHHASARGLRAGGPRGRRNGCCGCRRLGTEAVMQLDALVGTAPNTAARLQELAPPNGVVIGGATHELVDDDFICEKLPPQRLKRLEPPARAFLVRAHSEPRTRRLVHSRRYVPLVGRSAEFELISSSPGGGPQTGKGQTVPGILVEPGIGKSRLAQELLDHLADTPLAVIVLTCTPLAAGTALYPVIEALRRGDSCHSAGQQTAL